MLFCARAQGGHCGPEEGGRGRDGSTRSSARAESRWAWRWMSATSGRYPTASTPWPRAFGGIDVLVSNAGIQIVHPIEEFSYAEWKKMLAIHLDGAFLTTKGLPSPHVPLRPGRKHYLHGIGAFEGGLAAEGAVRDRQARLDRPLPRGREGEAPRHGVRANVICPGFVRTPLVEKQIPEQAKALGITEQQVIKDVMLKDTVDGEFTTVEDVAEAALFFAAFRSNALTGQSLIVSHGWFME